jgi:hypothetical protein
MVIVLFTGERSLIVDFLLLRFKVISIMENTNGSLSVASDNVSDLVSDDNGSNPEVSLSEKEADKARRAAFQAMPQLVQLVTLLSGLPQDQWVFVKSEVAGLRREDKPEQPSDKLFSAWESDSEEGAGKGRELMIAFADNSEGKYRVLANQATKGRNAERIMTLVHVRSGKEILLSSRSDSDRASIVEVDPIRKANESREGTAKGNKRPSNPPAPAEIDGRRVVGVPSR